MLLGSHLSIAGGMHKALIKARGYGFSTLAIFVRNQVQWRSSPLQPEAVETFRRTRSETGISPIVAHGSYLVNLAGRYAARRKSISAMLEDLRRCGQLGIEYLVTHPGSREDTSRGIVLVAEALGEILAAAESGPTILLETTAGQGNSIGCEFAQLAEILSRAACPQRLGVCLDTCHIFAAGYDIRTPQAWRNTMKLFDDEIGIDRLFAIHLNDSLRPLGSRVDRHAHIGKGEIGLGGFANLLGDDRLENVPMILETPKGKDAHGRDWDVINAAVLRQLEREIAAG